MALACRRERESNVGTRDFDAFGDVREEVRGIFGAEQAAIEPGLKKFESVHVQPTKEGVVLQVSCQGCSRPTHIIMEWPEAVALKYGVNPEFAFHGHPRIVNFPTKWEFLPHENAWRPDMRCGKCGFHFPVRISPDEPERFLKVGRQQGFINPDGEAQVSRIAAVAAQRGQAARR